MAKVRKWIRILHRDIGYISAGLVIIYAISGIAVNHVNDWNPNNIVEKQTMNIGAVPDSLWESENLTEYLKQKVNIDLEFRSSFRPDIDMFKLFYDGSTVDIDLSTGEVNIESVRTRQVFRQFNFLHLNDAKGVWTFVADLFAAGLIFLAISGLFMIRDKKMPLTKRAIWMSLAGVAIPVVFLIIYYYMG
ncbi:MAG: PepSY-associated TM helix domain-containing protein [Ignavibacteriaceae bacterium]|nr:PepSY-associated TM helix domain-containing protein [Ignavibacteriaceae bacterium]